MHALVTGVAGFVGSHLAERLLRDGHRVRGVDCFTPYYDVEQKRENMAPSLAQPGFELVEADLGTADPRALLDGIDVVFHQAAQPGVRLSWSDQFPVYAGHNVLATQRLLEAAVRSPIERFVYASSSSVYGNAPAYPTTELDLPRPHSPYGVTKLAAEHLCGLYAANWGVPTVSLRYFTVCGPRQRPDMAMHRLVEAATGGPPFPLYGSGQQVRDFTFVSDVVDANLAAARRQVAPGTVVNVAGGSVATVAELVELTQELVGREVEVVRHEGQPGDVERTGGSIERARELLAWRPVVDLEPGLSEQIDWHRGAGPRRR